MSDNSGLDCSTILVANKTDVPKSQRKVSEEDGMRLADLHNIEYYEVSAIENTGIHEAVNGLARSICKRFERKLGQLQSSSPVNANKRFIPGSAGGEERMTRGIKLEDGGGCCGPRGSSTCC